MTPAPHVASTGEHLTREIIRAQATNYQQQATAAPLLTMGNMKAAAQTYNAGALFTNNATALKG